MLKKFVGFLSLCIVIFTLAACGGKATNSSESEKEPKGASKELKIYTTVYPLQFFAEQIAGDQASVESILPPGSDSHTYEPTTSDMIKISESDAFIYNGAGLESYANKISKTIQSDDVKILEASKGIDLENHVHNHEEGDGGHESDHTHEEEGSHEDEHAGHNHGDQDPHVWLDPIRSIQLAEHIKDVLVELKPGQEEIFNQNFEELKGKLENLDQDFRAHLENLPENKIIVSHAAYGYWEKTYGIEQIAVSGLSPTNEPSHKEVQNIIRTAEKHGLKHVFFEQNITPKVADIVRKEIDAEALRIHNLSVLTEEDIKNNEDYFTLMQHNLEELTKALSEPSSVGASGTNEQGEHDHGHTHQHNEETAKIYEGYFENSQVKDRSLSDWEGDWQSVYPYLQDGTLDEVFTYKAEQEGKMTAKEYKEYYNEGYQTNVGRIQIQGNKVTFFKNGEEYSGEYIYDGYEILTYDAGNRGVRYVFKLEAEAEGLPQYIQFSDHSIYPTEAAHYHLYWGDDREKLLDEVTHWPTYYPSDMDGHDIAHEMMEH
ncbi:zinc transport system substrate-binding protein [Cytobacillus firmus]|uniref:Zinc transport system substrate-binding protein n=2 Tax=Cytobacillus TaxID=2675230 RepID=A0A366JJQ9_CYTFI|nr:MULTISPECIES: zinc ABC transporter substrate-binding protein AdcA [Cytobacillus]RBP87629.1 zinc transport system substrate-binding protein [Cytobacillus firmus]TDX39455.1 zinc transport system substrate-binding protein [Cytobacillus oceanisediminis]